VLTDSEVLRIRYELGFNLLNADAAYWIGVTQAFEQIIQPFLESGASTTSSTAVVASTTPAVVTITLASAAGFSAFDRAVVDVDSFQEISTIRAVSGSTITLVLSKAHTGTYPVLVEGGESIVREILNRIREVKTQLSTVFGTGALKKVDEIEWYQSGASTQFGMLGDQLTHWRNELASALGIPNMWASRGGARLAVY